VSVIDISLPIEPGMIIYEGDPGVTVIPHAQMARGAAADVSLLTLGTHTGTHVDAPAHFLPGATTVDQLSWNAMMGPVLIAFVASDGLIGRERIERLPLSGHTRVLFKTRNSGLWARREFTRDYVALDLGAATFLIERGVRLVGIDYLSIEAWQSPGHPVHRRLLEADVVILEGLNLAAVEPGIFELLCLPLPLKGLDGAPCRAVLRN
jgi:arylformamidase